MGWIKKYLLLLYHKIKPHKPEFIAVYFYKVKFRFKGDEIMKHVVRLSWVESVGTVDFPIVSQKLVVKVSDGESHEVDIPVGTNVFDFLANAEVEVHCELTASNAVFTSDAAVLDFKTPAFPPVPTKPDAPTDFKVEFLGTKEE